MDYQNTIAYLDGLTPTFEKPGLERIKTFLQESPYATAFDQTFTIQVGGTNGKGSTTALLADLLRRDGYKTGRFIGPHLLAYNERIAVDGNDICDADLAFAVSRMRSWSERFGDDHPDLGSLSWFEILLATAVDHFVREMVQAVVLEVGLGGRFDATTAVEGIDLTVITNVDMDHMHILGDTKAKIAREKAGIIKPGIPLVTAADDEAFGEIMQVVQSMPKPSPVIRLLNTANLIDWGFAPLDIAIYNLGEVAISRLETYLDFVEHWVIAQLAASMERDGIAAYQRVNVATALLAYFFVVDRRNTALDGRLAAIMLDCVRKLSWPGRFQMISGCIVDGAHNRPGARALKQSLGGGKITYIFGCYSNKDLKGILNELLDKNTNLIAVSLPAHKASRQAASAREIIACADSIANEREIREEIIICEALDLDLNRALDLARRDQRFAGSKVVVCGSFQLVKAMLEKSQT